LKITNINLDDTEKVEIVVEWVMKRLAILIQILQVICDNCHTARLVIYERSFCEPQQLSTNPYNWI
jgi:hypothetical protein